ncbi:hypothetical protein WJX77_010151 [Trebouxia sp. C0004]
MKWHFSYSTGQVSKRSFKGCPCPTISDALSDCADDDGADLLTKEIHIRQAMEVFHPGEWHCRHLLLKKGTLVSR